jgi:hypothetical protein
MDTHQQWGRRIPAWSQSPQAVDSAMHSLVCPRDWVSKYTEAFHNIHSANPTLACFGLPRLQKRRRVIVSLEGSGTDWKNLSEPPAARCVETN